MAQVELLSVSPSGNAPPAVIEQAVDAPLLVTIGVTEKAVPTVPITVLGEILMVGRPAFIVNENVATLVFVPAPFLAVTV